MSLSVHGVSISLYKLSIMIAKLRSAPFVAPPFSLREESGPFVAPASSLREESDPFVALPFSRSGEVGSVRGKILPLGGEPVPRTSMAGRHSHVTGTRT